MTLIIQYQYYDLRYDLGHCVYNAPIQERSLYKPGQCIDDHPYKLDSQSHHDTQTFTIANHLK